MLEMYEQEASVPGWKPVQESKLLMKLLKIQTKVKQFDEDASFGHLIMSVSDKCEVNNIQTINRQKREDTET